MFETDKYEQRLRNTAPHAPDEYEYVRSVDQMSFLYWGEHCVECAAPDCFRTCDQYQPRPDMRCRRFSSVFTGIPPIRPCAALEWKSPSRSGPKWRHAETRAWSLFDG